MVEVPRTPRTPKTLDYPETLERYRRYGPRKSIDPGVDPGMEVRPGVARTGDAPFRPVQGTYAKLPKERSLEYGGIVRKTGTYKLHAGERVVPATPRKRSASVTLPRGGRK